MAEKKSPQGSMRLDKFLTEMGCGSRSEVKRMARKGRIQVNGKTVLEAEKKIHPGQDQIFLDGQVVEYAKTEYYMLNKPKGTVSATEDGRYPTVVSLIESAKRRDLFPVGRLDLDTEGLLLITNDGALAHRLLSPRRHVDKAYLALLEGRLPSDAEGRLAEGVTLEDGTKTLPAALSVKGPAETDRTLTEVVLTIQEGKFHQVKRMFEALGCRVVYLKRLSMGPLKLDEALGPGEFRPLTQEERGALLEEALEEKTNDI